MLRNARTTLLVIGVVLASLMPRAEALDAPAEVKIYEPVLVTHESGTKVQILPWGTAVPSYLDERHIIRSEAQTVFAAPPGAYLVVGDGALAIVLVQGGGPAPPGPNPGPGPTPPPGPGPDPDPAPSPDEVPGDDFGNVGRLARSTLSVVNQEDRQRYQPKIKETYEKVAKVIRDPRNGVLTLNEAQDLLQREFRKVFEGSPRGTWDEWARVLNEHSRAQEITRLRFADYLDAIARGL